MSYRERLAPTIPIYLATALVIPASLLIFLPISVPAGVVTAALLYAGTVAVLVATAPVIAVADGELRAGRARIPVRLLGDARAFEGSEATAVRGVELDARAYLCIRGWIDPVVRVEVTDPDDPAPYWVLSTRHPERLVAALGASRGA